MCMTVLHKLELSRLMKPAIDFLALVRLRNWPYANKTCAVYSAAEQSTLRFAQQLGYCCVLTRPCDIAVTKTLTESCLKKRVLGQVVMILKRKEK